MSPRSGQSIRGGGVGGAPPPRTGFARGRYPTSSHSATQLSSNVPHFLSVVAVRAVNSLQIGGFAVGRVRVGRRARAHGRLQRTAVAGACCAPQGVARTLAACLAAVALALVCLCLALAGCGGGSALRRRRPGARSRATRCSTSRRRCARRASARGRAGRRGQDPRHRRSRRAKIDELVAKAFAESDDAEARLRARREAVARREGRVLAGSAARARTTARRRGRRGDRHRQGAQEAFDRLVEESEKTFSERSYEDIDYKVNERGDAVGVVEDFAVFGTEAEVKRTINAAGGESLAEDDRYTRRDRRARGRAARHLLPRHEGADRPGAARRIPRRAPQAEQFLRMFPIDKLGPIAASFSADGERLAIDAVATGARARPLKQLRRADGRGSTPLLGELPGDSWVALGAPKLGETAEGALPAVRRRARRRGDRAAAALASWGSTSSRTSSAGSATSRSSCAGPRRTRSTAAR